MTPVSRLSRAAYLLGYAGLLPQVAALVVLASDPVHRFAALIAGFGYAAIILSFLGGTWWGLAARAVDPPRWTWFAAVAPSLIALAATLVQFVLAPASSVGLTLLGAAILLSPLVDRALVRRELAPAGWLSLRIPLSVGLGLLTLALLIFSEILEGDVEQRGARSSLGHGRPNASQALEVRRERPYMGRPQREEHASMAADPAEIVPDPTDPYAREAQTFPRLAPEMLARLAPYGREERLPRGAVLFSRGERSVDFWVVVDGAIEIFDTDDAGEANVFTVHGPGQFTGELDLFNDREILVSGRTGGPSRVIRVARSDFRRLVSAEPDIGEVIMRAFILRRVGLIRHAQGGVVLVGGAHDGDTLRLQRFLTRNGYPHRFVDADGGAAEATALGADVLPAVVLPDHQMLANPSNADLADRLGLTEAIDPAHVHDVAVVGAGPGGLAAAVYAASEGLDTVVVESIAPGGQAGTSSKIENYLGFPTGISGQALAGRAQVQAQKFGARLAVSRGVDRLACEGEPFRLELDGGGVIQARSVVVATGATYRKLDVPDYDRFEGQGIHYAATAIEADVCRREEVAVVGGGNSAGQAAVFLSRTAGHVHILVRGEGLAATMSDYLVQRILSSPKITLHRRTEVTALHGDKYLRRVTWTDRDTGGSEARDVGNLFVMIGATPNTGWLADCLDLDGKGFVRTGHAADGVSPVSPYATSRAGVFAIGDVRSGSVKRVASSVGEGSVVVSSIHQYLAPVAV